MRCSPPARCTTISCRRGCAAAANIVVETGTARDPHHFACLIGYGATAVYPYMAYQTLFDMMRKGAATWTRQRMELGRSYRRGIRKGLFKIMSKMGISTIASYRSAQLFEIVGLVERSGRPLLPRHGVSRIQGANFEDLHGRPEGARARRVGAARAARARAACSSSCTAASTTCTTRTSSRRCSRRCAPASSRRYQEYAKLVNERPVVDAPRPAEAEAPGRPGAARRSRSRRADPAALRYARACRWARCRPRRTRRWPSR